MTSVDLTAPLIQVAGVRSLEAATMLVSEGVPMLGYPLVLDHHAEDLPATEVAKICHAIGDRARHVVITYLDDADAIVTLLETVGTSICQLHGPISPTQLRRLRAARPSWTIIKSVVFGRAPAEATIHDALSVRPWVDAFITDTFDPSTGASGATGRTHDWSHSSALVRASDVPVMLAGGLHADNVMEAIEAVRPAGVDVHTGVEDAAGAKCRARVRAFMTHANSGLERLRR